MKMEGGTIGREGRREGKMAEVEKGWGRRES